VFEENVGLIPHFLAMAMLKQALHCPSGFKKMFTKFVNTGILFYLCAQI
jgi:hypothetical protein